MTTSLLTVKKNTKEKKILNKLTNKTIKQLFSEDTLAIHIEQFLDKKICQKLATWIRNHSDKHKYTTEVYVEKKLVQKDVGVIRIGTPFNLTYGKPKYDSIWEKYYFDGEAKTKERQSICSHKLDPINIFKSNLNELWEYGASIANFDDKKMFAGIARITLPNANLLENKPHYDSLPEKYQVKGQLGANFYLEVPEKGGELEVWDLKALNPSEIKNLCDNQDFQSESIKSYTIKPKQGDLVIINTRKPHAVKTFSQGNRISLNCFIGYKKLNQPLLLWS